MEHHIKKKTCEKCKKEFRTNHFARHKRTCEGKIIINGKSKCRYCAKNFRSDNLKRHMSTCKAKEYELEIYKRKYEKLLETLIEKDKTIIEKDKTIIEKDNEIKKLMENIIEKDTKIIKQMNEIDHYKDTIHNLKVKSTILDQLGLYKKY